MIIPKKHQKYLKSRKRLIESLEREQEEVFKEVIRVLNIKNQLDNDILFDYLYNDFDTNIKFET